MSGLEDAKLDVMGGGQDTAGSELIEVGPDQTREGGSQSLFGMAVPASPIRSGVVPRTSSLRECLQDLPP